MNQRVIIHSFGQPNSVVSIDSAPIPQPAPGQVRVRLIAAPVNPSDLMTIRGIYTKIPNLPFVPGYEGVGIVEAAGAGLLGRFFVGKRVAFLSGDGGTWAQHALLPARQVVPISDQVPSEQAASFFVNPVTAYALTRQILKVPTGQPLLISAAGSTLGQMVIRLAKRFGFKSIAWIRRPEAIDELRQLGADHVIAGPPEQLADLLRPITAGQGIKYAIDCVGGATGSAIINQLAPAGRLIVYGTMSNEPLQFSSRILMGKGSSVEGFWLGNHMAGLSLLQKLSLVRSVGKLIKEGVLASRTGANFPLQQITSAIDEAERPARQGKVLLRMDA
jgi:NADPH:quinone reductase-like Zn-dependent oxidoreductase